MISILHGHFLWIFKWYIFFKFNKIYLHKSNIEINLSKNYNKFISFYLKMGSDEETAPAINALLLVKKIRKREKDV